MRTKISEWQLIPYLVQKFPYLTGNQIDAIIDVCRRFNNGDLKLSDTVQIESYHWRLGILLREFGIEIEVIEQPKEGSVDFLCDRILEEVEREFK